MRRLLFVLSLSPSAFAVTIYTFDRGERHYTVERHGKSLDVRVDNLTYTLPIDACTKGTAETFVGELDRQRERLAKYEGPPRPPEGTLTHRGTTYLLRQLALRQDAPEFFARTPSRFINLLVVERDRCPRSFFSP